MSYLRQMKLTQLVFFAVLGLVSLGVGLVKLAMPAHAKALSVAHMAGPWQAALVWSGSGCGPASGLVNFTLDSTGFSNSAKLVFHGACGNGTTTENFVIQSLNPDGSGMANLSCNNKVGCGWQFTIQVDRDRKIFNLTDVDPANPGNFVAGTAIRQRGSEDDE